MTLTASPPDPISKAAFRQRFRTLLLAPDAAHLQLEVRDYVTPQLGVVGLNDLRRFDAAQSWTGRTQTLSLQELRQGFADVMTDVSQGQVVRLTSRGDEVGALLPLNEFRTLIGETAPRTLPTAPVVSPTAPPAVRRPVILTLWNEAGGVGKTALVAELGAVLSSTPKSDGTLPKVLLIDMDPQRTLTARMGLLSGESREPEKLSSSVNTILQDPLGEPPRVFPAARLPGIDVVPAHRLLRNMEGRLMRADLRRLGEMLRTGNWDYDYILFDTPPSNGDLSRAALCASHFAIVPTPTEMKGVFNLANVAEVLHECQEIQPDLRLLAFIPVSYSKRRTHDQEILGLLQGDYADLAPCTRPITDRPAVYRNVIPLCSAIVIEHPRSEAAEELREVAAELLVLIERQGVGA